MSKYEVDINGKNYVVDVKIKNTTVKNDQELDGSQECLNAIYEEYQHTVRRSEKLDNKVYILSTICGIIFVFIAGLITDVEKFKYPTNFSQWYVMGVYVSFLLVLLVLYLYTIIRLGLLLTSRNTLRLNPDNLLLNKFYNDKPRNVRIYVAVQYTKAINDDKQILNGRFKAFNFCVYRTAAIFVIGIILQIAGLFIEHVK